MNPAKLIAEKGIDKVDVSMFPEAKRKEIYSEAAEIFYRQNRHNEWFRALKLAGKQLPTDEIHQHAKNSMSMGQYKEAYELFVLAEDEGMAEFMKENYL
ncbi:hypothetical protein JW968_01390 [Candidatus Woesearchaeota archaeon]|nr:hypothetical protein [Candidatus Woesearchaeota archaeon]